MWSMFLWFAFGPVRTSLWESCCVGCWWWVLNADWSGRSFRRHRRGYWCGLQVRNRTWDMDTGMDTDCEMRGAIHERCTKKPTKTKNELSSRLWFCVVAFRICDIRFSCSPVLPLFRSLVSFVWDVYFSTRGLLLPLLFPLILLLRVLLLLKSSNCL